MKRREFATPGVTRVTAGNGARARARYKRRAVWRTAARVATLRALRLRKARDWLSSLVAVTRFAFSAAQRRETGHGVSKLTDNVAWH